MANHHLEQKILKQFKEIKIETKKRKKKLSMEIALVVLIRRFRS